VDKILKDIEEKGWSVTSDLLLKSELKVMNDFFDLKRDEFHAAKVGSHDKKIRVESIRGDHTYWLDPLSPDVSFKSAMDILEKLKEKLNQKFYLGLKQFECHLAYYPAHTFYKKHLDRFEKDSSRSVSFIFYLNESQGGELVLYDKQGAILETIKPLAGTFVCFMSEDFPHEVKATLSERRSLTGWMHTKIIY